MKKLTQITTVSFLALTLLTLGTGCKRTRADINAPVTPPAPHSGTNTSAAVDGGAVQVL